MALLLSQVAHFRQIKGIKYFSDVITFLYTLLSDGGGILIIINKSVELPGGGGGGGARREGRVEDFPWFLFWTNNTIHQWREGGVRAAL